MIKRSTSTLSLYSLCWETRPNLALCLRSTSYKEGKKECGGEGRACVSVQYADGE